jgi:hypothetical protein
MSFYLSYNYSLYWIRIKDLLEEILQMLVSLQRRSIIIRMLYFFIKSKPISTFKVKLILKSSLITTFKLKRMLMNKEIEKQDTSSPYIHLTTISILRKILRCQI